MCTGQTKTRKRNVKIYNKFIIYYLILWKNCWHVASWRILPSLVRVSNVKWDFWINNELRKMKQLTKHNSVFVPTTKLPVCSNKLIILLPDVLMTLSLDFSMILYNSWFDHTPNSMVLYIYYEIWLWWPQVYYPGIIIMMREIKCPGYLC